MTSPDETPHRIDMLHEASKLSTRLVELSDELTLFARALAEFNQERIEQSEEDKGGEQ